ncbi:Hsp20/alpha crystallin family protein [Carboxylicivirga sp. M1479]|uniref:Hsp20/alpha crystallin family protein n=1 Tax=Carboxylicivirga sp. M1479 TaxID=2594476 RepID=UPI001177CDAF|nr:Hsp20/alpha crystallin family protein [Carboxylicivirga sp. M1479]TRX70835.1 Hsp20/alpha crystallin family protein [Carboxylicivirga sp. M1479]
MRLVRVNNSYPQVSNLFNSLLGSEVVNESARLWNSHSVNLPKVNIIESEASFELEVSAPGFEKDDFNVEVENNILTIEASKKETEANKSYSRIEFKNDSFKRSFSLSKEKINESGIEAKYENGILNVMLPIKEEAKAKPKRLVSVN